MDYTTNEYSISDARDVTPNDSELALADLQYKPTCLELFNIPFKKYKKIMNTDANTKKLNEMPCTDYSIFCDIKNSIEIVAELTKYCIFSNAEMWKNQSISELFKQHGITSAEDLQNLQFRLPKNLDGLILLFNAYPWCIDNLNTSLFNIISLDTYGLMIKLSKINQSLYFSTFPEADDANIVEMCKNDTIELWVNIKHLVKLLLKDHIEIAKLPNVDKAPLPNTPTNVSKSIK